MTIDERKGIVWPIPATYRTNDYDLANVTPEQVRTILRNVRTGKLEDQDRLFRLMLDTWPRLRKALNEVSGAVSRLKLEIKPAIREDAEEPTPQALKIYEVTERALQSYAPKPGHWELDTAEMVRALIDAYAKGIAVVEIVWQSENGIISPRCYGPVPAKYLAYPQFSNEIDRLMIAPQGANNSVLEDFPPDRFLIGIWSQGGTHPIHAANLRTLTKYWLASVYGLGWLMQFAQLFGIPMRTAKTDGSEEALNKAEDMLESIGSSGWAATGPGVEFEIHSAISGAGDSLPQSHLMDVADRACDILMLGQTLTTDNTGTGSRALGDVHAGIRGEVLQSVSSWVAGIITTQLIPAIVRMNFGTVASEDMPYCELEIPIPKDEKAIAERVKIYKEIGIEMPKQWLYEELGIPMPVDGEEVFGEEPEEGEMMEDEMQDDWLDEDESDEEIESSYAIIKARASGKSLGKSSKNNKIKRGSSKVPTGSGMGFDPNQTRIPKGQPMAGRWTDDGLVSKGQRARKGEMRDATDEDRKRLKIAPGFKNAKVTDDPKADLIAVATNAKGKMVSFYSAAYTKKQEAAKFGRISALNSEMPSLQSKIKAASEAKNHQALTMRLITATGMRNGGDKGGGKVDTFGASNLRTDQVKVNGDTISMDFVGKKGVRQRQSINDPVLAQHINERIKDGKATVFDGNSTKTLNYLKEISDNKFKVHDFRTWNATILADKTIGRIAQRGELPSTQGEFKDFQMRVAKVVSRKLGNDPAMALKAYIHPAVFNGY